MNRKHRASRECTANVSKNMAKLDLEHSRTPSVPLWYRRAATRLQKAGMGAAEGWCVMNTSTQSGRASAATLAATLSLLGLVSSAHAEGSEEVGLGQRLVDDTLLDVDVERVGEAIFLRAASDVASAVDVEITSPSGLVQRGVLSPGQGWTTTLSTGLCSGYPFTAREVGTHRVRFIVRTDAIDPWLRTLTPFDVAVTPSGCTAAPISGRLHATRWHLRAYDWSAESAFSTSFYVLAHRDIVALDLAGVAGYEYFIQAGPRGLEAPYERTSQPARVAPAPTTRPVYPVYLNPPARPDVGSDELGQFNGVTQSREAAMVALSFFEPCVWEITIDRDHDGVFDVARDAPVVRGTGEPGDAEVLLSTRGLVGAAGARIRLQTAEVHFAGYDVETARPGISFARWNPRTAMREPLAIHWDDRALVLGAAEENPSPIEALDGLAAVQHGWGSYAASSPGNDAWVDTWAAARTQTLAFALEDTALIPDDTSISRDAGVSPVDAASLADAAMPLADAQVSLADAGADTALPLGGLAGGALCSARPNARPNAFLALIPLVLFVFLRRRPA